MEEQKKAELKAKFGEVYEIEVEKDGKIIKGYFKKPNLQIISAASKYSIDDPIRSGEILFDSCWLDGDEDMNKDDEVKLAAMGALSNLFELLEAKIKKL